VHCTYFVVDIYHSFTIHRKVQYKNNTIVDTKTMVVFIIHISAYDLPISWTRHGSHTHTHAGEVINVQVVR